MSEPRLCLIAAVARNGVIGRDNQLPWHLPEDLKYFRATTWGKPIVMGRKTFESLGRPLPGRTNIVLTRQADLLLPGAVVVSDLDQALRRAASQAELDGVEEVMVIGGDDLYRQLLGRAERLYLTRVETEPEGDAFFPDFDPADWELIAERVVEAGAGYPAHRYQTFDRRG